MSLLTLHNVDGFLYLEESECRAAGQALGLVYRNASPFPHIMIDDFIDAGVLRSLAQAYPDRAGRRFFDRNQERLKYQFKPSETTSGLARNILSELNSQAFLGFLSELTGIAGLIPDPYYAGGGLHETCAGGHLSIHADFNIHNEMKVERRLNLLIYLNDNWDLAYGGELELWDRAMSAKEQSIAPLLGRAVIFNTALDSYHGHPQPLGCPPDRSRRSIAAYYYTAVSDPIGAVPIRTTNFRARPNSGERRDWAIAWQHWVNDWVPARLQRYARRLGPH
jgi:hypothetical protein